MSERYTKIYELPANLYTETSPVIIRAGALYIDNTTTKTVAQLKLLNISNQQIKAVRVAIVPLDTIGREIDEEIDYQYLDLNVIRNEEFGQRQLIRMNSSYARAFSISIKEVIFINNSIWESQGAVFEALPIQIKAQDQFSDEEIAKQYRIKYGEDAKIGFEYKDLWICACGGINHNGEKNCCGCGRKDNEILNNEEQLKFESEERIKKEKEESIKQDAEAKRKARKQKTAMWIILPIILIAGILLSVFILVPNAQRNKAREICERGTDNAISKVWSSLASYLTSSKEELLKNKKMTYTVEKIDGDSFHFEGEAVLTGVAKMGNQTKKIILTIPFSCDGSLSKGEGTYKTKDVKVDFD